MIIKRMLKAVVRRVLWFFSLLLPIKKNRIVFISYYGRGYGDTHKYICDKLLNKNYDIIWLVKNHQEALTLPNGVKPVRYGLHAIFYLATAKIWVNNCRSEFIFKKKKQFYLQTWHGGGIQKKVEADAENHLSKSYIRMAKRDSKNADLILSDSHYMTNIYLNSFWYKGPVYESGYPRYDILLGSVIEYKNKVCEYFNLNNSVELLLYAPTFRVDHSFDAYNVDFKRVLIALEKRFGKKFIALVHLHPNVANIDGGIPYDGKNIINATFYPDMQELEAAAAVLLGDYSGVNYEFSIRKLPVFRYMTDLDSYKNDRSTYCPIDEYPYPYALNNDELEEIILNFDNDSYLSDLERYFKKIGAVIEPGAALRVANLITDYVESKNKKQFINKYKDRFICKADIN